MSIDYNAVTLEDLTKALYSALSGNNQLIQQASTFLRTYVKYISSLPKLTELLLNSQDERIRLYSTVLMKRSILTHFQNMSPEDQEQFKKMLLTKYNNEKSFLVQKNVAGLIGKLIPVVDLQNWKDLQVVFEQAIQSAPDSKMTLVLLNELIGQFKPPKQVIDYMLKCLFHSNLLEYALNCIHSYVEAENTIQDSIPQGVIEAWNASKWDQDLTLLAIQIFNELALKKTQLKPEVIQWVVQKTVKNSHAEQTVRVAGLDFLKELAQNQYKSKVLNNNDQLLKYVVQSLCLVVCNPPKQGSQESVEAIEDIALWHLETYAENIKQKKFYPLIFDIIVNLVNSNDVNKMNAGFLIMGSISKFCAERLKRNLANPIMNVLIPKGLEHPAFEVRGAAINALIFFAEYLVPNIIDYHTVIVPSMVKFMNDSIEKVGEHALIALQVLFDSMEEDQIMMYLPDIVPIMYKIWSSPTASLTMKKTALGTIGSLINASEQKFQPYIEPAYNLALDSMKLPDTAEGIYLKSEGITILGRLAFHFTKDQYKNKRQFFTNKIFPLLEPLYSTLVGSKDPNIREGCFTFFYLLATSIGQEFTAIFDKILVQVIKSCEHDPSVPVQKKTTFSLDQDSEPQDGYKLVNVKIPELDEKSAAIHALGALANACPIQFIPHFKKAYQILQNHYQHFHDNIRIQSINAYQNLTQALIKSQNEGKIPEYTAGIPCVQRYPQALEDHFNQELIPRIIFFMTEQHSADVSACAIETLETLTKAIGPALIDKSNDQICDAIIALLEGRDQFIDQDESEEEEEEDDGQTNEIVFSPLCDLIPAMAKVLKTGFQPNFKAIFPSMMKYMQEERQNINDNIEIVGSFAQIFNQIPSAIGEHQNVVLAQIAKLRQLNDEELNRNICYCLGVMFEGSPQTMTPFLNNGITQIKGLYQNSISPATKQNALAAIARIIIVYNPQLPLQVLLSTMIDTMPFKADESEQKTIWRLILHLSNVNGDVLRPHLKKILGLLQHDIKEDKKYHIHKQPIKSELLQFGSNLNALMNA